MSNANKIGRVDRRVKTPGTVISSDDGFKRVYEDLYLPDKDKALLKAKLYRKPVNRGQDSGVRDQE